MYYKDDECQAIMRQLFIEVIVYNFQLFEQTADADLSNIADVLESFYVFNSHVAKKIPQAYTDGNIDCIKLIRFGMNIENYTDDPFSFEFNPNAQPCFICSNESNDFTRNWSIEICGNVFATFHHAVTSIPKRYQCRAKVWGRGHSHHVALHWHLHVAHTSRHFCRHLCRIK